MLYAVKPAVFVESPFAMQESVFVFSVFGLTALVIKLLIDSVSTLRSISGYGDPLNDDALTVPDFNRFATLATVCQNE